MRTAIWIVVAFGIVVLLGGIIGYITKQSLPSLVAGSLFGLALLGSGYALNKGVSKGYYSALIMAVVLTIFFHLRYVQCEQFLPSGLMSIIGCLVTISLLVLRPKKS